MSQRENMRSLVIGLMSATGDSLPQSGGSSVTFGHLDGNGRLPKVVVIQDGQRRTLIDPQMLWPDGSTSLTSTQLSPDGRYLAYGTKRGGRGFVRWHVLDVASDRTLDDEIIGVPDWSPISWAGNGSGFYYGGYGTENNPPAGAPIGTGFSVRFHHVGALQSDDRLVFDRADQPSWLPYATQSSDGRYEIVGAVDGSGNGKYLAIRVLGEQNAALNVIRESRYDFVANDDSTLYFYTNANSPNGQLIAIDLTDSSHDRPIISSTADTLEDVTAVGNTFVARYLEDDRSRLVSFSHEGKNLGEIRLPGSGSVTAIGGTQNQNVAFLQFSNPTTPETTFSYAADTGQLTVFSHRSAPFDVKQYVTEELFARSLDGTKIPLFVAHRRGMPMNGKSKTLLTGYGGFGDPYLPKWSTLGSAWLAKGGTFAIACVRGGGEYGEAWHRAGLLENKHHAFEDFDAVARYLVDHGFTSPSLLGLYGYSGGGLLVGVTEVQHPEDFGAVVEAAGPVDVLRGHTYGSESAWIPEVGSPTNSEAQFDSLFAYAPLVHIRRGQRYPATLIRTSSDDERVSPAHAYKFAATMQWAQCGDAPVLLYVAHGTGHEGGGSLIDQATPLADAETFLMQELGVKRNTVHCTN